MTAGVVVIGAGQAAGTAVRKLRASGYAGALTLVGEEPALPDERPPLSKAAPADEYWLDTLAAAA